MVIVRALYAKQKLDESADEAIVQRSNEMTEEGAPVRVPATRVVAERCRGRVEATDRATAAMDSSLCAAEKFRVSWGQKRRKKGRKGGVREQTKVSMRLFAARFLAFKFPGG